jgi:hypothetical protein
MPVSRESKNEWSDRDSWYNNTKSTFEMCELLAKEASPAVRVNAIKMLSLRLVSILSRTFLYFAKSLLILLAVYST